ncbi:MAG: hypothetical protein ABSD13_05080 [Candidatus Korobacteraceae bacterium]|jgi:hypothetical protein
MKSSKPLHNEIAEETVAEPETGLPGLIRLANLLPADAALPCFPDDKCMLLGSDYSDDDIREREFLRFLDENFPRERFGEFRQFLDSGVDNPCRPDEMYDFVMETREALRMIATHQQARSTFSRGLSFPWAQVGGWKVDRIRVCENCGKLFFAKRNNKLTCSDRCAGNRRVRRLRKHRSQYEQARKLKSVRITEVQKEPSSRKQGLQGGENGPKKTR